MIEFRKKQKVLYNIMKILIIFSSVFLFVYIGIKPFIVQADETAALVLNYICDGLVIASLAVLFMYYSKYGKCDSFLTQIENEISDAGYYLTSRTDCSVEEYSNAVFYDLKSCGYSATKNVEINDFEFYAKCMKKKEFFYIVNSDEVDRNDILAYLDSAVFDITANNLKRSGSAVVCFICDKAEEDAIALSKMITASGKKEQLKFAIAIAEVSTKRVYFLGNCKTKCQQMIANFVMNCDVPIKEEYIAKEHLPFQAQLEEKMKDFNIKDFKSGNFYVH